MKKYSILFLIVFVCYVATLDALFDHKLRPEAIISLAFGFFAIGFIVSIGVINLISKAKFKDANSKNI